MEFFNNLASELTVAHEGAVAFEYVIILIIMAVALFFAFNLLRNQLMQKSKDISSFIANNGTVAMGTNEVK